MTAAVVPALVPALVPVSVYLVVAAAASGRLARNRWVWLRTSSARSSEIAWRAGHAVALRRLRWSVFFGVSTSVVSLWELMLTDTDRAGLLPLGLVIMMLVMTFQASARGAQAAALVEASGHR